MNDENLKGLPVVVLSTSEEGEEIAKMYKMRCNSYIVKPVDFDQFLNVVRAIGDYWFTVVVLPKAIPTEKARGAKV
jgi:DNA-binding NarL/FixJ family response regulator